jgi:hypothetical protein
MFRAFKVTREIDRIGKSAQDSIAFRTVWTVEDLLFEALRSLFAAPNVSVGEKEELLRCVLLQTRQTSFSAVDGYVILIS